MTRTGRCLSPVRTKKVPGVLVGIAACVVYACTSTDQLVVPPTVTLSAVTIDSTGRIIELGTRDTLTATTVDTAQDSVNVPVVWRSSNEKVATFERGGVLVAHDTGSTFVVASSLGVSSTPTEFLVVWLGAANIDSLAFAPPSAMSLGATLTDSIRVRVTNIYNAPTANAKVAFTITAGGGDVSPDTVLTSATGIAAAQWTIGPNAGLNAVTAKVLRANGTVDTLVKDNLVTFSFTGYQALTVAAGDNQTGEILSKLPTAPSVKLVDSLGVARAGVPITFTVSSGGRLNTSVASTNASGIASPGTWTLGEIPGDQTLTASVSDARVTLHATGTGSPEFYKPQIIAAGGFGTCAIESDGSVKCWGQTPQNGGDTTNVSSPIAVKGTLVAASIDGGATHFCALSTTKRIWCWGVNALMDTSGANASSSHPVQLPSDIDWSSVSAGNSHNCAISLTQDAYCWGTNGAGQLGDQSTTTHYVPTLVAGGFAFTQIASGANHTCALTSSGSVFCWGDNTNGEIGDGTFVERHTPTAVSGTTTFQSVGAGQQLSCALGMDNQAYCWGRVAGQVRSTPTSFPGAPAFNSITVGATHACGLTSDGTAYCWGDNASGQLGDSSTTVRTTPTPVAGGLKFTSINAGLLHTCALTADGAAVCWGRNDAGELAEAPATIRTVPKYVVIGVNP
jgi:alpha-tubulin suppressor-like RCC1 family protein